MGEFSNPDAYEIWMGRWSRRLAPALVAFAGLAKGGRLLDVGSGTGALSLALLAGDPGAEVVGIEPAEAYVAHSRQRLAHRGVCFERGDAQAIPFDDGSFDATLSLLILQEIPDPPLALAEMRRVTRSGGRVVASQWDFAEGMPMLALFWDAVTEVVATAEARQAAAQCMAVAYPGEAALRRLWREAGLLEIEAEHQAIEMAFSSFDDYWSPFLTNVTPTSSYAATLAEDQVAAVERRLREATLGGGADRPFSLTAHAWAIRGTVP